MSSRRFRTALLGASALVGAAALMASPAAAQDARQFDFDMPAQPLTVALKTFGATADQQLIFSERLVQGREAPPLKGAYTPDQALAMLLAGSGLTADKTPGGVVTIRSFAQDPQGGSAAGAGAEVEALIVTAQKREEDIQDVPIAMSAFTQEQLERSQIAGGPDLMTQIPNMTFTKTNFTSYSIQIRGIGTQAISATTDAAVAVAFNNTPFIRNRFFEQEFYDLQRVEVLRGPQGTLYGRNATAGVVNIISAKPNLVGFQAKVSADVANFNSTRLEGMVNVPLAEEAVALRLAGAWTKRDGYSVNEITGNPIDGRDLWSTRVSLRVSPSDAVDMNLIWEHFEEDDDRLRSGKQLCHQDDRDSVGGLGVSWGGYSNIYSQGCLPASLYGNESFEAPNGNSLPYYLPLSHLNLPVKHLEDGSYFYPYTSLVQSRDLRVIESTVDPDYRAKSDLVELQASFDITDALTIASETSYNYDTIYSKQDFNRFNTTRGAFAQPEDAPPAGRSGILQPGEFGGIFCDPQIGCADRLVAVDVSRARSRQFSQELRLSSNYDSAFNFSIGANFLRYDTEDKYYVFINTLTLKAALGPIFKLNEELGAWEPGVTDGVSCLLQGGTPPDPRGFALVDGCSYIDPNPIDSVNDLASHYFLSRNPYKLISYAVFGEAYYDVSENLKVTAGLRWTVDKKEAPRIPSWVLATDVLGYPILEVEEQEWREPTGRFTVDWKPDFTFTDETLLYASYAHGYKAGGSNPPPTGVVGWGLRGGSDPEELLLKTDETAVKPKVFDPEFVDAFELGAKNTLLGGALTLNLAAFYYDYRGYQVSQIIDRSAVNYNFDSTVWGLEIEADWRPLENLRFGFKGGYENTRVADGERAIDIMERNAGHGPDSDDPWIVVRPFPTFPSNCVLPAYAFDDGRGEPFTVVGPNIFNNGSMGPCEYAYTFGVDPVTRLAYVPNPTLASPISGVIEPLGWVNYPGFNPLFDYGNNGGEGFFKELGGNELPNAPDFTATITADYTVPLPADWLMTLHTDLYYQSEAWSRVFNMEGYDKLKAFTNVNLAAIFTNEDAGWKVMAYVKNVFDKDNITGAFLNSDDTGLTTNVFLVEPRLFGLRVTKEWNGEAWWAGVDPNLTGPYPLTFQLGGMLQRHDAEYEAVRSEAWVGSNADLARAQNHDIGLGHSGEVKLTWQASGSPWSVSGGIRYGRVKSTDKVDFHEFADAGCAAGPEPQYAHYCANPRYNSVQYNWARGEVIHREEHDIADFMVGRDVGLGGADSTLSAGVRYAEFNSTTHVDVEGTPDWYVPEFWAAYEPSAHHFFETDLTGERAFRGFGPVVTWDASLKLLDGLRNGQLNLDLSASGGVLFGKQETAVTGEEWGTYYDMPAWGGGLPFPPSGPAQLVEQPAQRSNNVSVPTAAVALGLSYGVGRTKVSAGYKWERYFDLLDVGYAERKDADRTIDGPYFKLSVGFGG